MKTGIKEKKSTSTSNKELKLYVRNLPRGKTLKVSEISYPYVLKDKILVANAVKRGVTNNLFEEIKSNSPFDDLQWSKFLDVNIRTLQRYKSSKDHIYKPLQSERIFELAEIVSAGKLIFDTDEQFKIWLVTPNLALGKERPINLLDSSYGKELVLAELNRIEHGVFVV